MTAKDLAERLDAVAALVDLDLVASREADRWVGCDGEPCSDNEAALITSASSAERELAEAICGSHGELDRQDCQAVAALLRLAAGSPSASTLHLGLREAFTGSEPANRAAAFAGAYQRLALPGLDDATRKRAAALLDDMAPFR